jgi:hypothetical protein
VNISQGLWQGVFKTSQADIPFRFEVQLPQSGQNLLILHNADERVVLPLQWKADSAIASIELYEAELALLLSSPQHLEGVFRKTGVAQGIPFKAIYGSIPTFFPELKQPDVSSYSLQGKWDIVFHYEKQPENHTVGVFSQGQGKE